MNQRRGAVLTVLLASMLLISGALGPQAQATAAQLTWKQALAQAVKAQFSHTLPDGRVQKARYSHVRVLSQTRVGQKTSIPTHWQKLGKKVPTMATLTKYQHRFVAKYMPGPAMPSRVSMAKSKGAGKSGSKNKGKKSKAGDPNKGDVWVDNVGNPPGPGHEQDPHLACSNINLWGNGLGDGSGMYTIDSWPPTGSQTQAYSSSWQYNTQQGGSQVISVINAQTLVNNAIAAGAQPVNKQGYHFKLEFSQDPQKHKTFWVNCPSPSPTATPTTVSNTSTPTPQTTNTPVSTSTLKLCKIAGYGVTNGTTFVFNVGGTLRYVSAGYCITLVYQTGTTVQVTELHMDGYAVTSITSNGTLSGTNTSTGTTWVTLGSGTTEVDFTNTHISSPPTVVTYPTNTPVVVPTCAYSPCTCSCQPPPVHCYIVSCCYYLVWICCNGVLYQVVVQVCTVVCT